jgi:hypothetical protein
MTPSRIYDVGLDEKIFPNEVCGVSGVVHDAADSRCSQKHDVGSLAREEVVHLRLRGKVKLIARPEDKLATRFGRQPPDQSPTYQASVAGDENPAEIIHFVGPP